MFFLISKAVFGERRLKSGKSPTIKFERLSLKYPEEPAFVRE